MKRCHKCGTGAVTLNGCDDDRCRWGHRWHEHVSCDTCGYTWTTVWLPKPIVIEVEDE